jgi:hypothetical protein
VQARAGEFGHAFRDAVLGNNAVAAETTNAFHLVSVGKLS